MRIEEFLSKHIDGYLFHDLDNMAAIRPNTPYGAAGYPMILSILSGMEVLGGILSPDQWKESNGNKYFLDYWDNYLCKTSQNYKNLGKLVRNLVRHGIAHTYITKPGITIWKSNSNKHLVIDGNKHELEIDAIEFWMDFRRSYQTLVKPLVFGSNIDQSKRKSMENRLNEMISSYKNDSSTFFSQLLPPQPTSEVDPYIQSNTEGSALVP